MDYNFKIIKSMVSPFASTNPAVPKSNKNTFSRSEYYNQMRPLYLILRLAGRFPYYEDSKGHFHRKYISLWTLYTAVINVVLMWISMDAIMSIYAEYKDAEDFALLVLVGTNIIVLFSPCVFPVNLIYDWTKLVHYLNQWHDFELLYQRYMSEECRMTFGKRIAVVAVSTAILLGPSISIESCVFQLREWYHYMGYFAMYYTIDVIIGVWVFSFWEISSLARKIDVNVAKVISRTQSGEELSRLRLLWIELSSLTQSTGSALATSVSIISLGSSILIVSILFGILSGFGSGDLRAKAVLVVSLVMVTAVFLAICESADGASESLGRAIIRLTKVDFGEAGFKQEVQLFIQSATVVPPDVSLARYCVINRQSVLSLMSATVTYLIVLVQFNTSQITGK